MSGTRIKNGLFDRVREMYERGRPFQPKKAVNHGIVQVYLWNRELDLAAEEIQAWRAESLRNKYIIYLAAQHTCASHPGAEPVPQSGPIPAAIVSHE